MPVCNRIAIRQCTIVLITHQWHNITMSAFSNSNYVARAILKRALNFDLTRNYSLYYRETVYTDLVDYGLLPHELWPLWVAFKKNTVVIYTVLHGNPHIMCAQSKQIKQINHCYTNIYASNDNRKPLMLSEFLLRLSKLTVIIIKLYHQIIFFGTISCRRSWFCWL